MKSRISISPLALAALAGGALEEQPGATLVPGSGPPAPWILGMVIPPLLGNPGIQRPNS